MRKDVLLMDEGVNTVYSLWPENSGKRLETTEKVLLFVVSGDLTITAKETIIWKMVKEDYILFPEGSNLHLNTVLGAKYIVVQIKKQISPELELSPYAIYNLKNLEDYCTEFPCNKTILAGAHTVLTAIFITDQKDRIRYTPPGDAVLFCLEGRGTVSVKQLVYRLSECQELSLLKGEFFSVKANRMRALLLSSLD